MEKNTVLAIVLCSVIIFGWFGLLQPRLFPDKSAETEQTAPAAQGAAPVTATPLPTDGTAPVPDTSTAGPAAVQPGVTAAVADTPAVAAAGTETGTETAAASDAADTADATGADTAAENAPLLPPEKEEQVTLETELLRVVLSSQGGDMVSYQLKEHQDKNELVEMILPAGENGIVKESHAFTLAFGGLDAQPIQSYFKVSRPSPLSVEFSRDFSITGYPQPFTLTKRYDFQNSEYMFRLTITVSAADGTPLNFNNAAYTLGFGPQIGPTFQKLDQRYEYRQYYTYSNGKRKNAKIDEVIDSRFTWAAIAGKYFTAIMVPDNTLYRLSFSTKPEPGLPAASRLYMVRPALNGGASDVYHFYLGPKNQDNLGRYDTGDNNYKLRDLGFTKAASTSGILSPLEWLLKLLLRFCYQLVHNYGVAIIMLTLLVKLVLFPLTKKSSEASIKMQALAPKIKELQDKYKDNPAKLNVEMGALYKREGHSPVSGCLPLVIQMPILFAMYNLFNNHFDLRGAMFLRGWIPDLSLPESVWNFGTPLPLLGWDSLRLLPFIYVGSQLLYGVATKTPEQQGNPSMKMMMFAMPVAFFFILYNVPSGLLVFWIFSNIFTLIQQIILNKYLAGKKAAVAAEPEKPTVIAPPRRKKKR